MRQLWRKSRREKILTCAKTFLSVTMVLQVPQDGKNFSGHMFIGLIVELPAKATALTKRDSLEKANHLQLFKKLHHFINEGGKGGNAPIFLPGPTEDTWHTHHILQLGGLVSLVSEEQESDKWEEESNIPIVNSIEGKCYYFPCFLLVRVVDPSEGNEPQNMFRVPPLYCPLWAQTKMDEWIPMRCKVIYKQIDPLQPKIPCATKYILLVIWTIFLKLDWVADGYQNWALIFNAWRPLDLKCRWTFV